MSKTSGWNSAHSKLQFFTRVKRLITKRSGGEVCNVDDLATVGSCQIVEERGLGLGLGDLQKSVKMLNFGSWDEKEKAAEDIRRLSVVEGVKIRKFLAELGVVPSLVAMIGSEVTGRRRVAVGALIELANGSFTNKALIVDSEILKKIPKSLENVDEPTREGFALLLLSLSSLANTKYSLDSSGFIPSLKSLLESNSNLQIRNSCIGALHNLSTSLDCAGALITNGLVPLLISLACEKETSDNALATLGNLVVTMAGRKDLESSSPLVPEALIEVLTWEDKPKSQETAAYILMILAHQSAESREKMAKSGIVPVLLEVALLGSPLAQKRALKMLQWFKDERQVNNRGGPHSGPQTTRSLTLGSPVSVEEGKRLMKKMVTESLHKNMEIITRRANAASDSSSKRLAFASESSKSLPF